MSDLGRNKVQPIRSKKDLEDCFVYLRREINKVDEKVNPVLKRIKTRNYYLLYLGINIGLRISDLLRIKAGQVKNGYIQLREKKTGKLQQINVHEEVSSLITKNYINKFNLDDDSYLFASRIGFNKPMSRQNASLIITEVKEQLGWKFPVNTHTPRKTFGYHFYKKTKDVVTLQRMFNHRDSRTTLIYIGIIQEEIDQVRREFKVEF